MDSFLNALYIIPILTFLVFIHEIGHFITARRAGMKVEEFGIGLPPRVWGYRRGETLYSINAIPVGGFVRVLGEDGKNFDDRSMQAKTAGQRALFFAAGSIMNFLTAFVLIAILLAFQGESSSNIYVGEVAADSPAAEAGWQPGDRFIEVAGKSVSSTADVIGQMNERAGTPINVVIERGGSLVETTVVPRENPPAGQGRTGIRLQAAPAAQVEVETVPAGSAAAQSGLQPGDRIVEAAGLPVTDFLVYYHQVQSHLGQPMTMVVERDGERLPVTVEVPDRLPETGEPLGETVKQNIQFERVSPVYIVPETIKQFFGTIQRMGEGIMMLVRQEVPLSEVAGPIGMGQLTSEVIEESPLPLWVSLANLTILLSLNLAILNLLPLPALDGGRLVFVLLEVLRRGRRIAPEKEGMVHFVGLVVLLGLMFVVAFVDIDRIISGNSLIQ